jgi:hypothetical protein
MRERKMLNGKDNSEMSTPLVRERSQVQSLPAAPNSPAKSTLFHDDGKSVGSFRDATEHEHAPSRRAGSVRDVLEAFEDWLDRQVLPLEVAEHANRILNYLRMAESRPLTPGCRANLAGHVAAISTGRL